MTSDHQDMPILPFLCASSKIGITHCKKLVDIFFVSPRSCADRRDDFGVFSLILLYSIQELCNGTSCKITRSRDAVLEYFLCNCE